MKMLIESLKLETVIHKFSGEEVSKPFLMTTILTLSGLCTKGIQSPL